MTGEEFKNLRIKLGLSQEELAKALSVTRITVSRWENSENIPIAQQKAIQLLNHNDATNVTVRGEKVLPSGDLKIIKSNKEELFQHYSKLLKKVNKSIEDLENDVEGLDGYKQLSELIKLKAEIQKDLDSL